MRTRVVIWVLVVTSASVCGAVDLEDLGGRCSSGVRRACADLMEISRDHEDLQTRMEAARLITDQHFLVEIALG